MTMPYSASPAYQRDRSRAIRQAVLAAYGDGTCAICGSTDDLQLDHVNGDGEQHRRDLCQWWDEEHRPQITEFNWRLMKAGFPNDPPLQVLCGPCHRRKTRAEARRTHCKHGHVWRTLKSGEVREAYACRTCHCENQNRRARERRAAAGW